MTDTDLGHLQFWDTEIVGFGVDQQLKETDEADIRAMLTSGSLGYKPDLRTREYTGTIRQALAQAWQQVQFDREVAAKPALETPAQTALREAVKLAFGKKGADAPLRHRGALRTLLIAQGATPRDADAKLAEIAAQFGTSLATLKPGKTPPAFKKPKGDAPAPKLDGGSGDEKKSSNPWKSGDVNAQIKAIRTLGTEKCIALARSAGVSISGAPLARNG
jgi:hypothetical protein